MKFADSAQGAFKARPTHETGTSKLQERLKQSQRKFEIEKDAKNQAYYFIIMLDLMKPFREFCRDVTSDDWHKSCMVALAIKSFENK